MAVVMTSLSMTSYLLEPEWQCSGMQSYNLLFEIIFWLVAMTSLSMTSYLLEPEWQCSGMQSWLYDCIPLHCHSGSSKYDVIDNEVMATNQIIISKRRLYDCIPLHCHAGFWLVVMTSLSMTSYLLEPAWQCSGMQSCNLLFYINCIPLLVMLVLVNMTSTERKKSSDCERAWSFISSF
jgi:hypothetical protein